METPLDLTFAEIEFLLRARPEQAEIPDRVPGTESGHCRGDQSSKGRRDSQCPNPCPHAAPT